MDCIYLSPPHPSKNSAHNKCANSHYLCLHCYKKFCPKLVIVEAGDGDMGVHYIFSLLFCTSVIVKSLTM